MERERELAALERRLSAAQGGMGGVVIVEAPAGQGKSRLVTVAGDLARRNGLQVLGARGRALEREFAFGVAIQLFEPRWVSTPAEHRDALLAGPARLAAGLLEHGHAPGAPSLGDQGYPLIHGLFWLTCNLVSPPNGGAPSPLVLVVDDAHHADRASQRFLAYLGERIRELPIAIVLAIGQGQPPADPDAIASLLKAADGCVLSPAALTEHGIGAVIRAELPAADDVFCHECARVTQGNPFLLIELLAQVKAAALPPTAESARTLATLAPDAVLRAVPARLRDLPEPAQALANAVAVLGDDVPLDRAARLAGLELDAAEAAAEALAAAHILRRDAPTSFVHPLVAAAVEATIPELERALAHQKAADILLEEEVPADSVAAHLLRAPRAADVQAVHVLRTAASRALAGGDLQTATNLLERALDEHTAHAVHSMQERTHVALVQSRALREQGRFREAAAVLAQAETELDREDGAPARELEAAYISAASLVPELADSARARCHDLIAGSGDALTSIERSAIAHIALQASLQGEPRQEVLKLAEQGWGEGALLEADDREPASWPLISAALLFVDELERDLEICDVALRHARGRGSPVAYAAACCCRTWPLLGQGMILDAAADADAAMCAETQFETPYVRGPRGALALAHLERAEDDLAERPLTILDEDPRLASARRSFLLEARAQLRLGQRRPREALQDALLAARLPASAFPIDNPGVIAWRSWAALAELALGNRERAAELAEAELEQARKIDVTRVIKRDLRILGLASGGDQGLELLREAVDTGDPDRARLEHVRALVALGGALRRANRRAAARAPLTAALEFSVRAGATALAHEAEAELAAAGGRVRGERPREVYLLTPSERRVAELAAAGLTNRQIAEALFVTPKTVEYHLGNIFRKLDVSSRTRLAGVVAGGSLDARVD